MATMTATPCRRLRTIHDAASRRSWRGPVRCSIRDIVGRAIGESFVKLNPVTLAKNPVMFVVEVGAALTTVFLIRDIFTGAAGHRLRAADRAVALVHRAVRQLRRSHGRSARQGPGRQLRKTKTDAMAKRLVRPATRSRWCLPRSCAPATW